MKPHHLNAMISLPPIECQLFLPGFGALLVMKLDMLYWMIWAEVPFSELGLWKNKYIFSRKATQQRNLAPSSEGNFDKLELLAKGSTNFPITKKGQRIISWGGYDRHELSLILYAVIIYCCYLLLFVQYNHYNDNQGCVWLTVMSNALPLFVHPRWVSPHALIGFLRVHSRCIWHLYMGLSKSVTKLTAQFGEFLFFSYQKKAWVGSDCLIPWMSISTNDGLSWQITWLWFHPWILWWVGAAALKLQKHRKTKDILA